MRGRKTIRAMRRAACFLCVMALALQGCAAKDTSVDVLATAEELIRECDYGEAARLADTATDGKRAREAYRLKGIALLKAGHLKEADEAFAKALSLSDGILTDMDFDISMYRALSLRQQELYAEANAVYDNILAIRPDDARALYAKGCSLLEENKISDAYLCFDEAGKCAGGSEELQELYVLIYHALDGAGYKEAALNQLEAALKDPGLSEPDRNRLLFYLGRTEEEEGLSPVERYNRTGLSHMARGEYEQAIEAFEAGLYLQEEDMQQILMRNRIAAYEYAGNFAMAAEEMETYVARYPEDSEAAREWIFLRTR